MQAMTLHDKIEITKNRISQWKAYWEKKTEDVVVSFSGGKDSTVLLNIAREVDPDMRAVFIDTGLEYPEIRSFVKTYDNVDWIKPKLTFKETCQKYGYPFFGKEVANKVRGARKFINAVGTNNADDISLQNLYRGGTTSSIEQYEELASMPNAPMRLKCLCGKMKMKQEVDDGTDYSKYNCKKYEFMLDAPFEISEQCCDVMKKRPIHKYEKDNFCHSITAMMCSESRLRTQKWLKHGCNAFDLNNPQSNPMSFWTEDDVLAYLYLTKIPIASVYGEIIIDENSDDKDESHIIFDSSIFDRPLLTTTGCKRTGCMFCGFGVQMEKSPNRFEIMKETHPKQYEYIMKSEEEGGLGYKDKIDWINEHGSKVHINY